MSATATPAQTGVDWSRVFFWYLAVIPFCLWKLIAVPTVWMWKGTVWMVRFTFTALLAVLWLWIR